MKTFTITALAVGLFFALTLVPSSAYSDDHTICMGMKCADGRRVRSETKIPSDADPNIPVYEGRACPKGIELPAPAKTLARGHAFIGADKKHVIIPISNPQRQLEEGDVLLSSYNTRDGGSPASLFFNGSGHAALVGTVDGKKYHIDSPKTMSGNFGPDDEAMNVSWTVLRLRKYPPGVNTAEDLEKMKKDAPGKLEAWAKERKEILAKVKIYFDAMKEKKYGYNSNYLETKVFDTNTRTAWREMLFPKDGGKGKCPVGAVYCSELPVTGFALADETLAKKMPKGFFLIDAVNAFDDKIFQPELKKFGSSPEIGSDEWSTAFEKAWKKLIDDIGDGRDEEVREFRKNEKQIKAGIKGLLALPKPQRPAVLALMTSKLPSLPVSPTDLWHDIFRPDGIFSYAGSMVSPRCVKTKTVVAADLPDAGKETKLADPPKERFPTIDRLPPIDRFPGDGELPETHRHHEERILPPDLPRGVMDQIQRRLTPVPPTPVPVAPPPRTRP